MSASTGSYEPSAVEPSAVIRHGSDVGASADIHGLTTWVGVRSQSEAHGQRACSPRGSDPPTLRRLRVATAASDGEARVRGAATGARRCGRSRVVRPTGSVEQLLDVSAQSAPL